MRKTQGQRWLADQLGVSQPRVSELVKEGRVPRKPLYTDADVAKAKRHLSDARAGNNASAAAVDEPNPEESDDEAIRALSRNPERVARIKLLIERTAKLKLEREMLAGGFLRKEDAEKEATARVYSVRAKLQEVPLRASLIANKTEAECERILTDWMREVCNHYANDGN